MQAYAFPTTPPKPPDRARLIRMNFHPLYRLLKPDALLQSSMWRPKLHQPAPYTAPCIVEFRPASPSTTNYKRTFIGWLPPGSTAHEDPRDLENYGSGAPMESEPFRSCLQIRFGLDHEYDDATAGGEDIDADEYPDADAFGPLIWLRMPVRTVAPGIGVQLGDGYDDDKPPLSETSAFVYLAYPAVSFYHSSTTSTNTTTRAAGEDDDKDYYDSDADLDPGSISGPVRYDDDPAFRIPRYVAASMDDAGLGRADMCFVDVDTAYGSGNGGGGGPLALMPGKWMALASAVDDALIHDLRQLAEAGGSFRAHLPWTPMLRWRVRDTADRVEVEVGEADARRCARVQPAKLFPAEKHVGVHAWGNFMEWSKNAKKKRSRASGGGDGGDGVGVETEIVYTCEHKISSTVERLGLVVRDEQELEERIMREARAAKKRKFGHGRSVSMPHRRTVSDGVGFLGGKVCGDRDSSSKTLSGDEIVYEKPSKRKSRG